MIHWSLIKRKKNPEKKTKKVINVKWVLMLTLVKLKFFVKKKKKER